MVTQAEQDGGVEPVALCIPDFVGRGAELATMSAVLSRPPAVVLVTGEAGVGKSRLVHEVLDGPLRSCKAIVVCCPPVRLPFTLGPMVDGLRDATGPDAPPGLTALTGALRPLFPEWAAALPPAPEPLDDPGAARHRLFRALAEVLDRLRPDVLVVEDAHWADEVTLEFLLFLTTAPAGPPGLVLTWRPGDVADGSLLRRLSARLRGWVARLGCADRWAAAIMCT